MTETIPTSEVLNRAADLIEERGWGAGPMSMYGEDGVCALGAVYAANFGGLAGDLADGDCYAEAHLCPAGQAVYTYLIEKGVEDWETDTVWEWNDDQSDGHAVIETFRACAVIEASRERESVSA